MTDAFEDELDFVESVIDHFEIGVNRTRVAAIAYSDNAATVFDFNAGAGAAKSFWGPFLAVSQLPATLGARGIST